MGLIKDGKAPKKIKNGNTVFYYDKDFQDYKAKECSDNENEYLFYRLFKYAGTLDTEVEILPEENDEWEDIYTLTDNEEYHFMNRQNGITKEDRRLLDSNFKTLGDTINQLIKNQRKIIEKLEGKDE